VGDISLLSDGGRSGKPQWSNGRQVMNGLRKSQVTLTSWAYPTTTSHSKSGCQLPESVNMTITGKQQRCVNE
jgi:hypothetical protein